MKYILNPCTDPHWNMAHDEFLLEGLQEEVFCLWQNRPSVIIGLNQSAPAEVNLKYLEENDITLARRVTGGGAVYHDLWPKPSGNWASPPNAPAATTSWWKAASAPATPNA